MRIQDVEGIGATFADRLSKAGVSSTDDLLEKGGKPAGRRALAEASGISVDLILGWVNHVDLMRISGVGSEYSDLLEAAGVDSPAELTQRNASSLATTMQELDAARPNKVRRIPTESEVQGWIDQAKQMPTMVEH